MREYTFWTKRGLLKRWEFEPDSIENEFLFALEYWLLTKDKEVEKALQEFMDDVRTLDGTYRNHIDDEVLKSSPKISHDQLTAYSIYSYVQNNEHHKNIWKDIKWFKYDGRFLHPRDIIFYGYLNKNIIATLCLVFIVPIMIFTFIRKYGYQKYDYKKNVFFETWTTKKFVKHSEAHLWGLRVKYLPKFFKWLYKKLCNWRFKSEDDVVKFYFHYHAKHPIIMRLK